MGDPARVFLRDASYDGQLARSMSAAYAGAADLGEVLATARSVGGLSGDHWFEAWNATADRRRATADSAVVSGEWVTARAAYLRAGEYYRQALLLHPQRPRAIRACCRPGRTTSRRTRRRSRGSTPGRNWSSASTCRTTGRRSSPGSSHPTTTAGRGPTLLLPAGYDSTAEAGWVDVPDALARGYNVVSFEGPGQGEALYRKKLYFRPDYEHVLSQVVDWFSRRSDVDASRIGLVGRSFGGYLAPARRHGGAPDRRAGLRSGAARHGREAAGGRPPDRRGGAGGQRPDAVQQGSVGVLPRPDGGARDLRRRRILRRVCGRSP